MNDETRVTLEKVIGYEMDGTAYEVTARVEDGTLGSVSLIEKDFRISNPQHLTFHSTDSIRNVSLELSRLADRLDVEIAKQGKLKAAVDAAIADTGEEAT